MQSTDLVTLLEDLNLHFQLKHLGKTTCKYYKKLQISFVLLFHNKNTPSSYQKRCFLEFVQIL